MAPSHFVLVILEESGFIMCDQDKAKLSNRARDWEPIWAWEFYPIVVPLMESSLVAHPTLDKGLPVFHHVRPLVAIKIHTIS